MCVSDYAKLNDIKEHNNRCIQRTLFYRLYYLISVQEIKCRQEILNVSVLEKFDFEGDNISITLRWEKWKRILNIYFETYDIEIEADKRAILLHYEGPALQDIYFYPTPP